MTVHEAYAFLPEDTAADAAFNVVIRSHQPVTDLGEFTQLPEEDLGKIVGDYVTASVAYFANYSEDPVLEDIGTTAWHAINQQRVLTVYAEDARAGAYHSGLPAKYALQLLPEEPNFAVYRNKQTEEMFGVIVVPPQFIERANTSPIEALAAMLSMLSQIRDFETGRTFTEPQMTHQRAGAIEADFLLHQLHQNPNFELSPIYQNILDRFPQGINTLPESARY